MLHTQHFQPWYRYVYDKCVIMIQCMHNLVYKRMVNVITTWGVWWMGLPPVRRPIDNAESKTIWLLLPKDLWNSKGKWKKGGAAGNRTQGLWLKLPALCHDIHRQPPLSLLLLLLCSWVTVDQIENESMRLSLIRQSLSVFGLWGESHPSDSPFCDYAHHPSWSTIACSNQTQNINNLV